MTKLAFNRTITIGNREVSDNAPAFFIAEAGVNHNGDLDLAKKLIDVAVDAGVDAVKFQSFKTESLILQNVEKANYQKESTGQAESQYNMLKKLEISIQQTRELKDYCEANNIIFLTTPFDEISLDELDQLDLPAYKISSTDLTNISFLRRVSAKGKPIIISTGMSYQEEVDTALAAIHPINKNVMVLQCTANYPIENSDANLLVMQTYMERYDMLVGYSDHTVSLGATPYAVALGAKVVEKHFTLDKAMDGPDHTASLDPQELKACALEIRKVEAFLGSPVKGPTTAELENRKKLQKCLVAARDIAAGEAFTEENIVGKRTGGNGISAIKTDAIVGQKAPRDFVMNEIIETE